MCICWRNVPALVHALQVLLDLNTMVYFRVYMSGCLQGFLNKRTGGLNKDWKRKFVTLTAASLTYYPSMNVSQHMAATYKLAHQFLLITVATG